jgi:HEAT repeat protein
MVIDVEKWRDGIGYDLDALRESVGAEREAIEDLLLAHSPRDWRDVEALALLGTDAARDALMDALYDADPEVRLAVVRYAPDLVSAPERTESLVRAIRTAQAMEGLSQILDEAEEFHPPRVIDALLRGALEGDGTAAVHFAALLLYLHGQAEEPFDWAQRPFFLRFNTDDSKERLEPFLELCAKIGVDPKTVTG